MNQSNLQDKIQLVARSTKLTNEEIAQKLKCSRRSVRRYAGAWKERVLKRRTLQDESGGERKVLMLYDAHIPYHDVDAYSICMDYAREWQPDEIIIAGDFVDFKDISSWKGDPRRATFADEIDIVRVYLAHLRGLFPHKNIVYIEGNHEHRLARYLWMKAPELCRLPEMTVINLLNLNDLGIEYISNVERMNAGVEPYKIGKLFVLHGHEINMSYNVVNMARNMYLKTHVNTIFGHHHQSQQYTAKKLDNTHEGTWMVGGLCKLSESYAPMTNWNHGFATIKYNTDTGMFKVRNKMIMNGMVL